MVATQEGDAVWVEGLVAEQQLEGFHTVMPAIDEVAL